MKRFCIIIVLLNVLFVNGFSLENISNNRTSFSFEVEGLKGDLDEDNKVTETLQFIRVRLNYKTVSDQNLEEKFYLEIRDKDGQSLALTEQVFLVLSSDLNDNAYYPGHSFMNSGEFVFTQADSIKIYNFLKNNTEIHMVLQTQVTKRVFLFSM